MKYDHVAGAGVILPNGKLWLAGGSTDWYTELVNSRQNEATEEYVRLPKATTYTIMIKVQDELVIFIGVGNYDMYFYNITTETFLPTPIPMITQRTAPYAGTTIIKWVSTHMQTKLSLQ